MVTRFHPLLVTLHWLLAILLVIMLGAGFFLLASMPNSDPHKVGVLLVHMSLGMVIFILTAIRLMVRLRAARPADATTGPLPERTAQAVHYGFYAVVFLMVATGYATAILAGLNRIVFQGSGEPLPPDFSSYPGFVAHGYLALLLAGLIALHVAAVLYHQLIAKDPLLRRMWYGRRLAKAAARAD
ncbi:MAG: cytochrome b/b6 domain-containing protein [Proteobacteria bacterium]|nr:cytochrome b/b6 domain-containing protein [Pseudomonadota bacterium]